MTEMKSDCGPGCNCNKPSGNNKLKAVICIIVLLAVCGIFVYKAKSDKQVIKPKSVADFAVPVASGANQSVAATTQDVNNQKPVTKVLEEKKTVGEFLDSLASLNKMAANQDAVFIFVPAKNTDIVSKATFDAIASAEKIIEAKGAKLGLYTLQSNSPEYENIAAQLTLPGMLVMSKGKGMGAVSGRITEEKILQAYVASSKAGGCGGSSGCGPSSSGCSPSSSSCSPAPLGPRVK